MGSGPTQTHQHTLPNLRRFDQSRGRYLVKISEQQTLALKAANLQPV